MAFFFFKKKQNRIQFFNELVVILVAVDAASEMIACPDDLVLVHVRHDVHDGGLQRFLGSPVCLPLNKVLDIEVG